LQLKGYEASNKKVNKIEKVKDLKKPIQAFEKIGFSSIFFFFQQPALNLA